MTNYCNKKKKKTIIILFIIFIAVFTACTPLNNIDDTTSLYHSETLGFWQLHQTENFDFDELYDIYRELLLEDFDFLENILLTHLPHLGVFNRRFQISMYERLERQRTSIESGNLMLQRENVNPPERLPRLVSYRFLARLGPLSVNHTHLGPASRDSLAFYFFFRYHGEELSSVIDWENSNFRLFYQLDQDDPHVPEPPFNEGVIQTEVLEPDRIAYISVGRFAFSPAMLLDQEILFDFYEQIQDFEHLIIDLRGNAGGNSLWFSESVVKPLINEPLEFRKYQFIREAILHNDTGDGLITIFDIDQSTVDFSSSNLELIPALEFVQTHGMSEFNKDDLSALDYVMIRTDTLQPAAVNFDFNGKVWLLVDSRTFSAAENAVLVSLNTGFATVVGTNTGGVMPSLSAFAILPNTGIAFRFDVGYFVDANGRSLTEFGITPDYLNRPGMNALQTVLAMIEEMSN